ncbi:hypothetical protein KSF_098880 [Reticulibacter mediterranei]|uniref:Uncharacterized protein n=1 Tax=Reticulibacter mediterranei TaxID=2778369 RepID=A0A8J3IZZ9_9CHLR|nr:hypothetical protein KSF_098880 [Reticulibacter mediterranei]
MSHNDEPYPIDKLLGRLKELTEKSGDTISMPPRQEATDLFDELMGYPDEQLKKMARRRDDYAALVAQAVLNSRNS